MKRNVIHIAVSEELKQKLTDEAKEKGLTLSAYIRLILIERK